MALNQAVARRLGLPPPIDVQYPGLSYSQAIDTSISPRLKRLPLLPRPKVNQNGN